MNRKSSSIKYYSFNILKIKYYDVKDICKSS